MLPDVLAYHEAHVARQATRAKSGPSISVIVNCTDNDDSKRVALASRRRLTTTWTSRCALTTARTRLWQLLRAAKGDYVYVMEARLSCCRTTSRLWLRRSCRASGIVACTGAVKQFLTPFVTEHGQRRRFARSALSRSVPTTWQTPRRRRRLTRCCSGATCSTPGCCVTRVGDEPGRVLVLSLMQRSEPVFTHR